MFRASSASSSRKQNYVYVPTKGTDYCMETKASAATWTAWAAAVSAAGTVSAWAAAVGATWAAEAALTEGSFGGSNRGSSKSRGSNNNNNADTYIEVFQAGCKCRKTRTSLIYHHNLHCLPYSPKPQIPTNMSTDRVIVSDAPIMHSDYWHHNRHCTINFTETNPLCRVVPVWNALPDAIVSAKSISSFKSHIRSVDLGKFLIFPTVYS